MAKIAIFYYIYRTIEDNSYMIEYYGIYIISFYVIMIAIYYPIIIL
jgi:hypothetical protein